MALPRSPRLDFDIDQDRWDQGVKSNSGACLIADALKDTYPHLSNVRVDMATVRCTDLKKGLRYIYLTTSDAQHLLLSFDQGWKRPYSHIRLTHAVQITNTKESGGSRKSNRAARLEDLKAKKKTGTLTRFEKRSLQVMETNDKQNAPRVKSTGKTVLQVNPTRGTATRHGGHPMPQGKAHPNLLRGTDRHFGAKLANPGQAFEEAVEQAVNARMAAEGLPRRLKRVGNGDDQKKAG